MKRKISKLSYALYTLLFAAVIGFGILLFMAKKYTNPPKNLEDIVLIDNAKKDVRVLPEDQGGQIIPYTDKSVFDIISKKSK